MSLDAAPDPRFRRFLSARFSAQMAAQMQVTAVAWQIYDLTGDPVALGLVGLAQFATAIPLMPLAGQLADRIERRRILIACYAVFAATMAALICAPHLAGPWLIFAIVAVFGAARVFEAPAATRSCRTLFRSEPSSAPSRSSHRPTRPRPSPGRRWAASSMRSAPKRSTAPPSCFSSSPWSA